MIVPDDIRKHVVWALKMLLQLAEEVPEAVLSARGYNITGPGSSGEINESNKFMACYYQLYLYL